MIACTSYQWLEHHYEKLSGFQNWNIRHRINSRPNDSNQRSSKHSLQRLSYDQFSSSYKAKLASQNCHSSGHPDALNECLPATSKKNPKRLVLIGDSHAAHLRPILSNLGFPLIQLTDRNLPNLWLGRRCREPAYCFSKEEFNKALEASLSNGSLVVLGLSPRRLKGPERNQTETKYAADQLRDSLKALIPLLERRRSKLLLIDGLPPVHCPKGQTFTGIFNRIGPRAVINTCSPSQSWIRTQNDAQSKVFQELRMQHPKRVSIFDTISLVCSGDPCRLGNDSDELFVWDELTHLTPKGRFRLKDPLQSTTQDLLLRGDTSRL